MFWMSFMKIFLKIVFVQLILCSSILAQEAYFPERGEWQEKKPSDLGVSSRNIDKIIKFAQENEYVGSTDLRIAIAEGFAQEPFHRIAGPTKKRGGPAGMIIKNGYVIGKWGDTQRVDMTFSVTKSYLSTIAGLAVDDGHINNVNDPVVNYVWDNTFSGDHNSKVTWHHLLTQSSDWYGNLFGMFDWADRPPEKGGIDDWRNRELKPPGTSFKYNDVRVNVLSYALLQVVRRPLPAVLKERIMDPIGASPTWRWYGYDTSWVDIDGLKVQSVSGGGHSGGGVFINTEDHARFGYLFLRDGNWDGKQLISKDWIKMARQPSEANDSYGYLWWLNQGEQKVEGVPESLYFASGFGGNLIIIDPEHDLLIVTRWLNPPKRKEFFKVVIDAMQ
jgi:CubicO group peptidase (beta-lactamase class C family)